MNGLNPKFLLQLKRLAYATCIGMFIVVLNGAIVTKTDSGLGCGTDFPLCNGKFVPAYTVESIIEYSHRFITGVVGLLVAFVFILLWRNRRDLRDSFLYASSTLLFTVIQAIMGALAVVYTQNSPVMALHFGFSLLAFASSFLLGVSMRNQVRGISQRKTEDQRPVKDVFRYGVWFSLLYTYIVIYVGAFVRHTDSAGGCSGWPLCNDQWIPDLSGGTLIAFIHRIAAALLFIVIAAMAHFAYHHYKHHRDIRLYGIWSLVLVIGQVLTGGFVVFTLQDETWLLFSSLLHTVFIVGLFSVLCAMSIRVWQLRDHHK